MSYDVLGINDWVLLTIIPADLISGNSEGSIWRFFLILIFVMAVFLIFLVNVYRFFNTGRRELERYAFEDSVTGGMNQAAFCLKYEELAGKMEPSAYSIVMMNVKGFKMINERFGTEAGKHHPALYTSCTASVISDHTEMNFVPGMNLTAFFCVCGMQSLNLSGQG